MIIGGFQTLAEYMEWLNTPPDPEVTAALDAAYAEDLMLWEAGFSLEEDDLEDDPEEDEED